MTTPDRAESVLSTTVRTQIADLMSGVKALPPTQAVRLAEAARDRRGHGHPRHGEDLYCINLTCWMGERVPYLLQLLLDVAAENEGLRERIKAAANSETKPPPSPHRFVRMPDDVRCNFCKACGEHVLDPVHDA
ncbi:hypothetical protein [Streptomyces sp. NPDC057557]|uniref:hypothetical protein n=1 Tax=Streptomyces sp. NPDC057557 TaxID=3346167 RepID=UPI0036C1C541